MRKYFLSQHTYICYANNRYVFLDIEKDRYLSLGVEHSVLFLEMCSNPGNKIDDDLQIVPSLIKAGLLTSDKNTGRAINTTEFETVKYDLLDFENDLTFTAIIGLQIFRACLKATFWLNFYHLNSIVSYIKKRKDRCLTNATKKYNLHSLAKQFYQFRPLYPKKPICLHDSIALIEFLSFYGYYPNLIFAVTSDPFRAHCWVQYQGTALNDYIDSLIPYTPIMVV